MSEHDPSQRAPRARRGGLLAAAGFLPIALAVALGALTGVGSFTFGYGEGWSYLSSDPQACANCHVMQDYYDTWEKSSHHAVAVCVDCHLPHDLVGKYIAKADNGFFHSLAFTLDNFHEPIQIKSRNQRIAQHNCVACHVETVHQMLPDDPDGEMLQCAHCHAEVGHAERR